METPRKEGTVWTTVHSVGTWGLQGALNVDRTNSKARAALNSHGEHNKMDAGDEETKTMGAVELSEQAIELSFHPHRDVIASGLLDGKVCL